MPLWEGGDGCEKPTSQLHTCTEGKMFEEIRNNFESGGGTLVLDHQVGVLGLAAAVLTLAVAFFLDFQAANLGAAVLGSDF